MIVIYFFSTKSQQFFAYVWAIFPVIAFFLVSFYTLDFLFSPSYLIMVPVFTIMFKINYKKDYSFVALLKMSIRQFVISFLAFIASSSFSWSIILNSSVTFLIVYLFFLPVMLPSVLPKLGTDSAVRRFPGVWKLLSF